MLRFKTTILKPWSELCELLTKQLVFQPEMGAPIAKAGDLAVAIKHLPESYPQFKGDFKKESLDFKLVDDVADGWKHGSQTLSTKTRRHDLKIQSVFEISDDDEKFKFIKNSLVVTHASCGTFDFLEVSSRAIKFWMHKAGLQPEWNGEVKVAESSYDEKAKLYYDKDYQIDLESFTLCIVKNIGGVMTPYDAPLVKFEVVELDKH